MQKVSRSFSPPLGFSKVMRLAPSRSSFVQRNSFHGIVYLRRSRRQVSKLHRPQA